MAITLYVIGAFMLIATAAPFLKADAWWVRIFDFPRVQVAFIAAIVIILWIAFVKRYSPAGAGFLLALLAAIVIQLVQIWPHTKFAAVQSAGALNINPDACISLLITNVYQPNDKYQSLLQLIEQYNPDIILAAETDHQWADHFQVLRQKYPHYLEQPQDNTYGMLFYSRLPLHNAKVQFLVDDAIPSVFAQVQLRSGNRIDLYGIHPRPPYPAESSSTLERDAELVVVSRLTKEHGRPAIVAGDLNDVAWSHTTRLFQRISGLLDPRIGRGMYNTFPTSIPIMRFPLDHIFHSADFKLLELERMPDFGSDHFPMFVSLCYDPQTKAVHNPPEEPNGEDFEEADKTVEKAKQQSAPDSDEAK